MVQAFFSKDQSVVRPVFAGLMAALVLVLSVFAASEKLHLTTHQDTAPTGHGSCAVCSLNKGQVEVPVTVVSGVSTPLSGSWTLPLLVAAWPQPVDLSVASSRGPPVSVSSR